MSNAAKQQENLDRGPARRRGIIVQLPPDWLYKDYAGLAMQQAEDAGRRLAEEMERRHLERFFEAMRWDHEQTSQESIDQRPNLAGVLVAAPRLRQGLH